MLLPPAMHELLEPCMHAYTCHVTIVYSLAFLPFGFGNGDREGWGHGIKVDSSDHISDLQYPYTSVFKVSYVGDAGIARFRYMHCPKVGGGGGDAVNWSHLQEPPPSAYHTLQAYGWCEKGYCMP